MLENENNKNTISEETEEAFKNALFGAIKSTEHGSGAYIDQTDGCIVLPMAVRRIKHPNNTNKEQ